MKLLTIDAPRGGRPGALSAKGEIIDLLKVDAGENVQSPHDNEAGYNDIYHALKSKFTELDFGFDFCFFDRIIGGLRLENAAEEHRAAKWLHAVDQFLCDAGTFTPEQFHFLGSKLPT